METIIKLEDDEIMDALKSLLSKEAETELDIRRSELKLKVLSCMGNMEKLAIERRRLELDELKAKFDIASDLSRRSDKIQRVIEKFMVGFLPEQDRQVMNILKETRRMANLNENKV